MSFRILQGEMNIPFVEILLKRYSQESIFHNLNYDMEHFDGSIIKDLAIMPKVNVDIIDKDLKNNLCEEGIYYSGEKQFDKLTDKVFRHKLKIKANIKQLAPLMLELCRVKDVYGIVGKDKLTGEIINFTHPLRVISLFNSMRELYLEALYVYKFSDDISRNVKEKQIIKTFVELYSTLYEKGIVANQEKYQEPKTKYIRWCAEDGNIKFYGGKDEISEHAPTKYSSYIYFSDILVNNTFCPHYAIFKLSINIQEGRLIGTNLKHISCLDPNISSIGAVCTGNNKNLSKDGIEGLKMSNLLSPYITTIYKADTLYAYVTSCIEKAKDIYLKKGDKKNEKVES